VLNPVTARDSSAIGYWDLRNNNLATAADVAAGTSSASPGTRAAPAQSTQTDWTTTATYPEALGYSYTADPCQWAMGWCRAKDW